MKTLSAKRKTSRLTVIELLLLVLFASFQGASAKLNFLSTTYSVGQLPGCVAIVDANGDGKPDLVCANYGDNTLTILTNSGGGIFGSNATIKVGKGPAFVIAADIRNLGKADLICANYGDGGGRTLTILTNNGSGIFGSNATVTVGFGPLSVAAADLKGAGRLDLITANGGTNGNGTTLTILTNNGGGMLVSNATITVGNDPVFITAADLNGDGLPDLISANAGGNSLSIFTNKGAAKFVSSAKPAVTEPTCVAAANINGDGKPDLVYASFTPSSVTVLTNNGSNVFVSQTSLPLGLGNPSRGPVWPQSVAVADLDGDGRQDVIVSCSTNVGFGGGALVIFTNNASYQPGSNTTVNVGNFAYVVIATDLNADGKPDLVVVNENANTLTVLLNTNIFPAPVSTPVLSLRSQAGSLDASWPSATPGWSLVESSDLANPNWLASGNSGFPITDDGTNKSMALPFYTGKRYFRLLHP